MRYQFPAFMVLAVLGGATVGRLWPEAPISAVSTVGGRVSEGRVPGEPALGTRSVRQSRAGQRAAGGAQGAADRDEKQPLEEIFGRAATARIHDRATRCARGWLALSTLHALAGRLADLESAAQKALEAGAGQREVLDIYLLLDEERTRNGGWIAAIASLCARCSETAWDPRLLAAHAHAIGEEAWAFDRLSQALSDAVGADARLARALVVCDAKRAATLLCSKVREESWHTDFKFVQAIAYALNRVDELRVARPFIQWALESRPFDNALLKLLASLDPVAALEQARLRVGEKPDDLYAWGWIADACRKSGDQQATVAALREVAERKPEPSSLLRLIEADASLGVLVAEKAADGSRNDELIGALAHGYLMDGQEEAAIETYERAQRIDPDDYEWLLAVLDLDPDQAVRSFAQRATREDAGDEIVGSYGSALLETGRPDEAFAQFERALRLDPSDPEWMLGIALADAKLALPILAARLAQKPDSPNRIAAHAAALVKLGRYAEGTRTLDEIVAKAPNAWRFRMFGRVAPDRALLALRRAIKKKPTKAEWWGVMADIHAQQGEVEEARRLYERALVLKPTEARWRRRLRLLE